jgi:hypothetical protein
MLRFDGVRRAPLQPWARPGVPVPRNPLRHRGARESAILDTGVFPRLAPPDVPYGSESGRTHLRKCAGFFRSPTGAVVLYGTASTTDRALYHVYRSTNSAITNAAGFIRLTALPLETNVYVDASPVSGASVYMIRAVATSHTGGGS